MSFQALPKTRTFPRLQAQAHIESEMGGRGKGRKRRQGDETVLREGGGGDLSKINSAFRSLETKSPTPQKICTCLPVIMALPMRMNISRRQLNTTSLVRVFEYRIAILWKLISSIFSMFSSSSGVLLSFFSLHCDAVSMLHVSVCGTRSISENGICSHQYEKSKSVCVWMFTEILQVLCIYRRMGEDACWL
jgi:hypothetical protein